MVGQPIVGNSIRQVSAVTLDGIHLGSPYISIGLKVSVSSFRSLEPPSLINGSVGIL